jgi:hypothetical protein
MAEEMCEGVKMLLDRMQNNPEDFDYEGRLYGYRNTMEEVLRHPPADQPMWYLNQTVIRALIDGYTAMHKQKFTAQVVHDILRPPPEYDINMDRPYQKPSTMVVPQNMLAEANKLIREEFEKEYAKNRNPRP